MRNPDAVIMDVAQRSDEWRALRAGRLTGSCAGPVIAERQRGSGELAVRRDLRMRLVVERLTGQPTEDTAKGNAVQHGADTEAAAFRAYEARTGRLVKRVGFIAHRSLMAGCSPDGYVGDFTGVIELKCPTSAVHLDWLRSGVLPPKHYAQCLHALWLTGAEWCDFMSFDDRFTAPELQTFIVRLPREESQITAYSLAVSLFLSEVDREVVAVTAEPMQVA